jgi:hypothetical protein
VALATCGAAQTPSVQKDTSPAATPQLHDATLFEAKAKYYQAYAELIRAICFSVAFLGVAGMLIYLRKEIRAWLPKEAELTELTAWGVVLKLRSITKELTATSQFALSRPPRYPDKNEPILPDYYFLNHTCFLETHEDILKPVREKYKWEQPIYHFQVILDSYYQDALSHVRQVEYVLNEWWPDPIVSTSEASDNFRLKQLTFGHIVVVARVTFKDDREPLWLNRYIAVQNEGPRLLHWGHPDFRQSLDELRYSAQAHD